MDSCSYIRTGGLPGILGPMKRYDIGPYHPTTTGHRLCPCQSQALRLVQTPPPLQRLWSHELWIETMLFVCRGNAVNFTWMPWPGLRDHQQDHKDPAHAAQNKTGLFFHYNFQWVSSRMVASQSQQVFNVRGDLDGAAGGGGPTCGWLK